ncbi:MAG: hypothetical protein KAX15_02760 [Candidatus Omnitrophica bacterium]|nr:hypothetical protein [Candidatus Omnitrophota bacterium]
MFIRRKIFSVFVMVVMVLITTAAFADFKNVKTVILSDASGDWTDKVMETAVGTYTSNGVSTVWSNGFCSLLVKTSAGSLAISFEVSDDNVDWYTPKDTSGNDLGIIETALASGKWIVFPPQIAQYIRFKFVITGADSTVSAVYRHLEER